MARPTLLIVEDDHQIRRDLDEVLTEQGYRVVCASNGLDALVALKNMGRELPSLIILDLLMPVMDGETFLNALYAEPRFQKIPVIILSVVARAIPQAAGFLKKPFDLPELLGKIEDLVA